MRSPGVLASTSPRGSHGPSLIAPTPSSGSLPSLGRPHRVPIALGFRSLAPTRFPRSIVTPQMMMVGSRATLQRSTIVRSQQAIGPGGLYGVLHLEQSITGPMTLSALVTRIPWQVKWGIILASILLIVGQCHARDRAIANAALWKEHWSQVVARGKAIDDSLNAEKARSDSLRVLVEENRRDFAKQLAAARLHKDKVVVLHDPVQGTPPVVGDTTAVVDLPIVRACTNALTADSLALSDCDRFHQFAQRKFLQDSEAIKLALTQPHASRARDIETGVGIGASLVLILHALKVF